MLILIMWWYIYEKNKKIKNSEKNEKMVKNEEINKKYKKK